MWQAYYWDLLVRQAPKVATMLLNRFPQLLGLECLFPRNAPANPVSLLPGLSQLTSLTLHLGSFPVTTDEVATMAQALPQLLSLTFVTTDRYSLADGFPVGITASCGQLQHLGIHGGWLGAVPPELGLLTALTRLVLRNTQVTSLPDSISQLSGLKELAMRFNPGLGLPPGLTACRQLTLLDVVARSLTPDLPPLPSLRSLLVSAVPNGQPGAAYWAQLTALKELQLDHGFDWFQPRYPPVMGDNMPSLRKLGIRSAWLANLPEGLYLNSLESLTLEKCSFDSGVPSRLAAAPQLRHLVLRDVWGIQLTAADVAVLSVMPALETLSLTSKFSFEEAAWTRFAAELQAAFVVQGHATPSMFAA